MLFSQSSYRLNSTICGSVAFRMRSPSFSTFRHAWKGNCSSLPLITMLGKSSRWTYRGCGSRHGYLMADKGVSLKAQLTSSGSSIPFLVTMICLGCSSTGRERISAATSSAVFHLAS